MASSPSGTLIPGALVSVAALSHTYFNDISSELILLMSSCASRAAVRNLLTSTITRVMVAAKPAAVEAMENGSAIVALAYCNSKRNGR